MNILVTGSSGQLGAAVVQELTRRDHKVIGIDIVPGICTSQLISVADRSALFPLVKGVEAIIHIASLHQPHLANFSRQAFIDINITGTLNLLEAAVEAQVRRFVYTSTTSLYGWALVPVEQAVWVTEDLAPCPRDIYDISKIAAEELCRTIASSAKMPIICLRVARFFAEAPELQAI
ncbi:MAG TPA: NAD(P)-dependent oxidoreductase, partial [Ktedonobacteraceae bacterium]|nr:NAD(P)-dependent oxidoreductase [Ktedonobacteraceae bacterium]